MLLTLCAGPMPCGAQAIAGKTTPVERRIPTATGPSRSQPAPPPVSLHAPVSAADFTPHVPRRAIAYQRAAYTLALFGMVWHACGLWLLLRTGLAVTIRNGVYRRLRRPMPPPDAASSSPWPPFAAVALFYSAFALLLLLWSLPVGLMGLALEHRYGFSQQSVGGYLRDAAVGMLFSLTSVPVIWCAYRLHAASPRRWWVWLWALLVALLFAQMVLQPLVIAPAYNRFTPLPAGPLRRHILALAGRAGITGGRVFVSDTSTRTRHVNAYVTGWGPSTRIVINDTALQTLPEDQILAMVGHEMGHYVEGHLWLLFVGNCLGAGLLLWLIARLLPWFARRFGPRYRLNGITDLAALPLVLLALYVLLQVQLPLANAESRYLEHRADAYGLHLTHLNAAMARLFVGFAERDYADPDPPPLLQWWFGSHPTLRSRIAFALQTPSQISERSHRSVPGRERPVYEALRANRPCMLHSWMDFTSKHYRPDRAWNRPGDFDLDPQMRAPVGGVLNLGQYLGRGKPTSRIRKVERGTPMDTLTNTNTNTDLPPAWVGIDIAKLTFDACLLRTQGKPQKKSFANTPEGFAKFLRWLTHLAPETSFHFCMEATGSYYLALATFLAEANLRVSVINPFRTHHAAQAQGAGNKTDPAEAGVLAEYCRQQNPPLWRRAAPEVRTLVALLRRLQTLKDTLTQEQNRLGDPGVTAEVVVSLNKTISFLQEQIADLTQQIDTHITGHPNLKADRDLLLSIPGIGELTAAWLMAELPDVSVLPSAASAAAYAGLAPSEHRSGTSVKRQTHLSKRGNAHLRRALYMPALTAMRFNPAIAALCERLLAKGRPRMVAVGAAMRKLVMIAYGVLKHRQQFTYSVPEA